MIKNIILILLLLAPLISSASIQQDKVLKAMAVELDRWTSESQMRVLMEDAFTITRDKPLDVTVTKQNMKIDGKRWTLGRGSIRVLIKAPIDKVKKLLTSPSYFQSIYNLDAPCVINEDIRKKADLTSSYSGDFLARIYKRVPVFEDQDYILSYKSFQKDSFWFQRASLVKDLKNFALRDSIQILQSVDKDTTIFREISLLYLRRWYLRLLGPQVRGVVRKELRKVAKNFKCIAESSNENLQAISKECWSS